MVKSAIESESFKRVVRRQGKWYVRLFPVEEEGYTVYSEVAVSAEPDEESIAALEEKTITTERNAKLIGVEVIDKSSSVNSFTVNDDNNCWLDKATRVGLAHSLEVEAAAGKAESVIYLNHTAYTASIETLQKMLSDIELYALEVYRVTEQHKATLNAMTDFHEIEGFDYTAGYPEKLSFTL